MSTIAIVGATGAVGKEFVKEAINSDLFDKVRTISRKPLSKEILESNKIQSVIASTSTWTTEVKEDKFPGYDSKIFFSGLGTTRDAVGGFENQYKVDHDINLSLAKRAKEMGNIKYYILISSQGANSSSLFNYTSMKGKLEDDIKELNFYNTIILRPGILTHTKREKRRVFEGVFASFASTIRYVPGFRSLMNYNSIDASDVAKAALLILEKNIKNDEKGFKVYSNKDMLDVIGD